MSELNGLGGSGESVLEFIRSKARGRGRKKLSDDSFRKKAYSYSVSELYIERVKVLAEVLGCSESEVVRRAIDEYYVKYYPIFRDSR